MEFRAIACPNCGADTKIDSDMEMGFCKYCGTQVIVDYSEEESTTNNLLYLLRKDIKLGRHDTPEFYDRLKRALEESPRNVHLNAMYESEIWKATVSDGAIISYYSKATKISLPSCITKIEDYAFCACDNIKELVIPDSVTYIGENIFSDRIAPPTIRTRFGTCAYKYALCNNIPLDVIGTESNSKIREILSDLQTLKKDIVTKKDDGVKKIEEHYSSIIEELNRKHNKKHGTKGCIIYILALLDIAMSVYLLFTAHRLYALIGIPLFFIILYMEPSNKALIAETYPTKDMFNWNIIFNEKINNVALENSSILDYKYWNKSLSDIKRNFTVLKNLKTELDSLDPNQHIFVKSADDNINDEFVLRKPSELQYNTQIERMISHFRRAFEKQGYYYVGLVSKKKIKHLHNEPNATGLEILTDREYLAFEIPPSCPFITAPKANKALKKRSKLFNEKTIKICTSEEEAKLLIIQLALHSLDPRINNELDLMKYYIEQSFLFKWTGEIINLL